MRALIDWLDRRTGCRKLVHGALFENVPGGSRWRYVWGSTLTFALFVQFITGLFLWMGYAPSAQTAWESVYYMQYEMTGGWLLRGLHHFTTQVMIVLLVLHLMQVVIDGAYRAPREMNFWFGLGLLMLVLALSLTGYLLPWDQKGYWATRVTTSLVSVVPVFGPELQRLIVGGPELGHHTLTRFFAFHAGVFPLLILLLITAHIYLFRVHGLTPKRPLRKRDQPFWPDQLLKDTIACLAVLAAVLFLILRPRLFDSNASLGADLGAPADPSEPYPAARPEWYFLFLYQFLKYFPGEREIWGSIIIPSIVLLLIFLMPFFGRWKLGHRFNLGLLLSVLAGASLLTYLAVTEDRSKLEYRTAVRNAHANSERIKMLASAPRGIPKTGALSLLAEDPFTQGPILFSKHCASCHRFEGHDGLGVPVVDAPTASDLKGFASRAWLAGLLDPLQITNLHYFGGTKFKEGKMVKMVQKDIAKFSDEEKELLKKGIAALSAEAGLKAQQGMDLADAAIIEEGRAAIRGDLGCTDCHPYRKQDEDATAPDLTGYGSREWLITLISNPEDPRFYGERNDRMPAFGKDSRLTAREIEILVDWLRGDWYEPRKTR